MGLSVKTTSDGPLPIHLRPGTTGAAWPAARASLLMSIKEPMRSPTSSAGGVKGGGTYSSGERRLPDLDPGSRSTTWWPDRHDSRSASVSLWDVLTDVRPPPPPPPSFAPRLPCPRLPLPSASPTVITGRLASPLSAACSRMTAMTPSYFSISCMRSWSVGR